MAIGGPDDALRAADGRVPGRRGRATRDRLTACTLGMLEDTSYRDLKVVDIAREAGTSPATFYQYFPDVESAILALAEDMATDGNDRLTRIVREGDWKGKRGVRHRRVDRRCVHPLLGRQRRPDAGARPHEPRRR